MYNTNFRYRPVYGNNRFIGGGFAVPFLLGGITGGLLAPIFYPRPYYYPPRPNFYSYPVYY